MTDDPELITDAARRITLRRVRDGGVLRLLGGGIVDSGRPVPDYVTAALRELAAIGAVTTVRCPTGELRFTLTDGEPVPPGPTEPPRPLKPPQPETQAPETRWPELIPLLDASPPWTFATLDSGVVTGNRRDGEVSESLWVVSRRSTGYLSRPHPWSDPTCTYTGPLRRLLTLLAP